MLGPVLAALGYATWRMHQQLSQVQQERVDDAQKAVERIYALKESVDELTEAVRDMRREIGRRP